MRTVVTRLVVTAIVATGVFAPTRVQAQEHVTSKPRVDFSFKADQLTARDSSLLAASRNVFNKSPIPRRRMSTGSRVCLGMAIGAAAGFALTKTCDGAAECAGLFYGMIGGGAVAGYFLGR